MATKQLKFRALKASEIDVRVQSVFRGDKGFRLLLYKDARCDMMVLDETVGPLQWKREHLRENHNCVVSIWDEDNKQWVGKEDTGLIEEQKKDGPETALASKGTASDSFKRACFNWGIGRELYTGPLLNIYDPNYIKNGKVWEKFTVKGIVIQDGQIINLIIVDESGKEIFSWPKGAAKQQQRSDENSRLKYLAKLNDALSEFDYDLVAMVCDELGEQTLDGDNMPLMLGQILKKIPTKERLDMVALTVKARSTEDHA